MSLNGPSLTGLRRALAEDRNYARVQAEAARGFAARSETPRSAPPPGLRSALLAEMADGLTAQRITQPKTQSERRSGGQRRTAARRSSWQSPPPAAKPRT